MIGSCLEGSGMKKHLLVIGLAVISVSAVYLLLLPHWADVEIDCHAPAEAGLVIVDCSSTQIVSVIEDSIETEGEIRKAKSLVRRRLPNYGQGLFTVITHVTADCRRRQFASANFQVNQDGRVVENIMGETGWQPLQPGTQGEALFETLCAAGA